MKVEHAIVGIAAIGTLGLLTEASWRPVVADWIAPQTRTVLPCPEWTPGASRVLVVMIDEETGAVQCVRTAERGRVRLM